MQFKILFLERFLFDVVLKTANVRRTKIFGWNIGGYPPNFMPYYIMEYLAGGSLRQHMDESFRNDERYVFERKWTINRIILAACNALAQAHSSNIYHRDLKPDNILCHIVFQ
jgi:eukaryotic-like serine/threonine-protein kinase